MTLSEVLRLFAFVELLDPRLSGDEAKARAWLEVLHRRMTYESALTAIKLHYGQSTSCVMPANLNQLFVSQANRQSNVQLEAAGSVPMPDNVRALVRNQFNRGSA